MNEKWKILIVEDEADTAYILGLLLKKNNFEIKIAKNGQEALEVIDDFMPLVVIADWNMPVMNGLELCERMKSSDKYKLIYFIILTARSTLQDRVKGLDVGADDFLLKPIENQELLARIRTGIRIHNLQNELRKIEHSKALIEMATTIGHKINNPLSSLVISLDNIKAELNNTELAKNISDDYKIIDESIKKIQVLAKDLTHLQQPELIQYSENKNMLNLPDSD
ncbi:MAG TPA: response regulator transcription factor [Ignavibacteria bacterium]|nr:response regulator transcription factor [Ignavibacteria bacterium]